MRKKKIYRMGPLILFLVSAVILVPAAIMLIWIFTERWAWPDLSPQVFSLRALKGILGRKEETARLFVSSILISTAVSLLSVTIGIMTSRALVFYRFFGKKIMSFFTILPFMVPATVFAMGIQITFIRMGLNNTVTGVILAHLICSLPYAVRLLQDGTEAVGQKLEEQARVLGAGPGKAFFRVTLPMLAPVVLSAASMSYIVSFSQYFLTLLIGGGNVRTFTIVMVPYLSGGDRNIACIYSAFFLGVTLIVFWVFELLAGRWIRNTGGDYYT